MSKLALSNLRFRHWGVGSPASERRSRVGAAVREPTAATRSRFFGVSPRLAAAGQSLPVVQVSFVKLGGRGGGYYGEASVAADTRERDRLRLINSRSFSLAASGTARTMSV